MAPESIITASLAGDLDDEPLFVPTLWIGLMIAVVADPNNSATIILSVVVGA